MINILEICLRFLNPKIQGVSTQRNLITQIQNPNKPQIFHLQTLRLKTNLQRFQSILETVMMKKNKSTNSIKIIIENIINIIKHRKIIF